MLSLQLNYSINNEHIRAGVFNLMKQFVQINCSSLHKFKSFVSQQPRLHPQPFVLYALFLGEKLHVRTF